jgi:hypothetical protein
MKIGRNDRCPCGSGRKYKHCHLRTVRSPIPEPTTVMGERGHKERLRRAQFGAVRPIIHARHQGRQLVAVGTKVFYSTLDRPINTFADFLLNYVRQPLGSGWGQAELKKPVADRHPIMRWYAHLCEMQKRTAVKEANGLYSMDKDGIISAYLHLAYDLYILDDRLKLQKKGLQRLRRPESFVGARYELLVAATCVRAGCDIEYEDETDSTMRHPEFVARHRETGCLFDVEAKGRGHDTSGNTKASMKKRLANAAGKQSDRPYVVFIDVNVPPSDGSSAAPWFDDASQSVNEVVAECGDCPFDFVVFTNFPHQYGEAGQPDPAKHVFFWSGRRFGRQLPNAVEAAIVQSLAQYDNIPSDFPQ